MSRRVPAILAVLAMLFALPVAGAEAKKHPAKHQGKAQKWKKDAKRRAKKARKVKAPRADWDRDGLNNRYERKAGTQPRAQDSDRDGVADGREDRDADRVDNRTEQLAKTSVRMPDSDRDGTADADEDHDSDGLVNRWESQLQWHPRNADTDGDGTRDGDENAGVVSAVTGSTVSVDLLRGQTLTANLTDFTDVICRASVTAAPGDQELSEEELEAAEQEAEDELGADDFEDEDADFDGETDADELEDADFDDEPRTRAATVGRCTVDVGMVVYDAEVEEWEGALEFLTLDLLGE